MYVQGVPKRMLLLSGFEFLTFGGVFLGVKNNPKNFGNQKILGCLAKIWIKGHSLIQNLPIFFNFHDFDSLIMLMSKIV